MVQRYSSEQVSSWWREWRALLRWNR